MTPEASVPKTQRLTDAERELMAETRADVFGGMRLTACATLMALTTVILFVVAAAWWLLL